MRPAMRYSAESNQQSITLVYQEGCIGSFTKHFTPLH
uniref:Uncharacterized protein n=1 Tax=Vitis vinifera TaxID=29760 RepID=A5B8X9_VITVI|nr:hypothetical protein VITISV_001213 [Vitis vinifera]